MRENLKKKKKTYIFQFNDSARFMANSVSNLVNKFSEEIDRIKCKYGHYDQKMWNFQN